MFTSQFILTSRWLSPQISRICPDQSPFYSSVIISPQIYTYLSRFFTSNAFVAQWLSPQVSHICPDLSQFTPHHALSLTCFLRHTANVFVARSHWYVTNLFSLENKFSGSALTWATLSVLHLLEWPFNFFLNVNNSSLIILINTCCHHPTRHLG